jgi:hypothetical protein
VLIDKKYKLESVVEKGTGSRPSMEQIYLQNGMAVATNGHALVFVPCNEYEDSEEGYLNPLTLKDARKQSKLFGGCRIDLTEKTESPVSSDRVTRDRLNKSSIAFPNVFGVLPLDETVKSVCFNAKILYELSQAMGNDVVTLEVPESVHRAITVRCPDETSDRYDNSFGLLMPVRMPDKPTLVEEGRTVITLEYLQSLNPQRIPEPVEEVVVEVPTEMHIKVDIESEQEYASHFATDKEVNAEIDLINKNAICNACGIRGQDDCEPEECVAMGTSKKDYNDEEPY